MEAKKELYKDKVTGKIDHEKMHKEIHGEDGDKVDYTAKLNHTKPVKFMQYTDSEGNKVTLGVDENDVPVMKFIEGERPYKKFELR
ncbi:MAG: hypothetical protein QF747_02150 [Patescibacteria group bacterium]|jgi:hypothetical protein|nr:hypothetical protein [Patescibacteria group bacterium]MDP6756399.1 hypothetical protein [Patescibacteria group bacterium]|tara:strand:+ start:469 stop:726 length:258 start_codon:yes stop_codon:yes gene_type:complete